MTLDLTLAPRFRRSIRIDRDFDTRGAIDGFHCPPSFAAALERMAAEIAHERQCAFTWTGPYGGGKSSLALALACLTGAPKAVRDAAASKLGERPVAALKAALPYYPARWDVLPHVTEKRALAPQIAERLGAASTRTDDIFRALDARIDGRGCLLILDELGRGLEAAASGDGDLHILQDLAEYATRSDGRFVLIGILHQGFTDYGERLSQDRRDDWAKIQGRFADVPISADLDETLDLIGKAMPERDTSKAELANVGHLIDAMRPEPADARRDRLTESLAACLPLHPLAATLLIPLSRRRFAQNQRSVFSFLAAAERYGFRDVMLGDAAPALYPAHRLWDYIAANYEAAVYNSPDKRRWAVGRDTVDRCLARGGRPLEVELLKTMALLELLRERVPLTAARDTLIAACSDYSPEAVAAALESLTTASEIVFRRHSQTFVLFAGSDFDIEASVAQLLDEQGRADVATLRKLAQLQPELAKRHHQLTGTPRWFQLDIEIVDADRLAAPAPRAFTPEAERDIVGRAVLLIPADGTDPDDVASLASTLSAADPLGLSLYGVATRAGSVLADARELDALDALPGRYPSLRGDRVALREIDSRKSALRARIEAQLDIAQDSASWSAKGSPPTPLARRQRNALLSDRCDAAFSDAPHIHNELLNCASPSSNAVSARTQLLKCMVARLGEADLGYAGEAYPAPRGLYDSLLKSRGLHGPDAGEGVDTAWAFKAPDPGSDLARVWDAADALLEATPTGLVTADALYSVWGEAPIGLKPGLAPVYLVAYALSRRDSVAVYGEGVFHSRMNDLTMDYLARSASDVGLRRVDLGGFTGEILSSLGARLGVEEAREPLVVAREVVNLYDALPPWITRTQALAPVTLKVREILKRAHDPNKLLFDDLPRVLDTKDGDADAFGKAVWDAVMEMRGAYPRTLSELRELLLRELDVRGETDDHLAALRDRAETILRIGGDLRVDAFIGRIAKFYGSEDDMAGLASLAASRHPRDWNDSDRERAALALAELARDFLRLEALAHVKGRKDNRQALAVVVGRGDRSDPRHASFEVAAVDQADIGRLVIALEAVLAQHEDLSRDVVLAALTEVTASQLPQATEGQTTDAKSETGPQRAPKADA